MFFRKFKLAALTTITITAFHSYQAQALDGKGNGGDAVVCYSSTGEIVSAELYDYFESKAKGWNFEVDFGVENANYSTKVKFALDRLNKVDPKLADELMQEFKFFESSQVMVDGQLVDIPDADPDIIPNEGCKIEQLAIRSEPQVPQDKIYKIAKRIWAKLDETNRAGLALHEIIYHKARMTGHENSRFARYLNDSISSRNGIATLNPKSYIDVMKKIKLPRPSIIFHGFLLKTSEMRFYPNGNIKFAVLWNGHTIPLAADPSVPLKISGGIEFYDDGAVSRVVLAGAQAIKIHARDGVPATLIGDIVLFQNGQIGRVQLSTATKMTFNGIQGVWQPGYYAFYANGFLESYRVQKIASHINLHGTGALSSLGSFFENGKPQELKIESLGGDLPIGSYFLSGPRDSGFHIKYGDNGSVRKIDRIAGYSTQVRFQKEPCKVDDQNTCIGGIAFDFDENGLLTQTHHATEMHFPTQSCHTKLVFDLYGNWGVSFYPNGIPNTWINKAGNSRPAQISTCVRGKQLVAYFQKQSGFFENGVLREGYLNSTTELFVDADHLKTFRAGCWIQFDENGFASGAEDCIVR